MNPFGLFSNNDRRAPAIRKKIPDKRMDKANEGLFSLLKFIILILLTIFLIGYIIVLSEWIWETGTVIETIKVGEICEEKDFQGEPITNHLCFELQRIKGIYGQEPVNISSSPFGPRDQAQTTYSPPDFRFQPFDFETPKIEYSISQLGNVGVGGTTISLGQIILSLKELLHRQGCTISGSIQRYGTRLNMVVILSDPDSHSKGNKAWEVTRTIPLPKENDSVDELIPGMVEDLAFQIAHDLSSRNQHSGNDFPNTWQAFKNWTLGWDNYYLYNTTRNETYLKEASDMAILAEDYEPNFSGSYKLLLNIGLIYFNEDNLNESIRLFREVADNSKSNSLKGDGFFGLGIVYAKNGSYDEAIINFDKSIELNSTNKNYALYDKAIALLRNKSYSDSIEPLEEYIKLNPKNAEAWDSMGYALLQIWRQKNSKCSRDSWYNDSLQAFNNATNFDKNFARPWNNEGVLLYLAKNYSGAVWAYNNSITRDEYDEIPWKNEGEALIGQGTRSKGTQRQDYFEEALKSFNNSIELNQSFVDAWYDKALTLNQLNRTIEALEACNKTLKIEPQYQKAIDFKRKILQDRFDKKRCNY